MRSLLLAAALVAGHALAQPLPAQDEPAAAGVERPSPGKWKDGVFRWFYNPRNRPPWLGADEAQAWVIDAARQWETCGIRMQFEGETDEPPGAIDGRNVVGWRLDLGGLRGITMGRQREGALVERDIAFSPQRAEFQRAPRLLRKVLVHEFGHAIGLTHSASCSDVMTLAADCPPIPPAQLPLEPTGHDLERCRALYGGAVPSR